MKHIVLIAIAMLVLSATAVTAEEMVCTLPNGATEFRLQVESTGPGIYMIANQSQSAPLEKHVDIASCYSNFDELEVKCHGGEITYLQDNGACTDVVCTADDGTTMEAQGCEKNFFLWFGPKFSEVYTEEPNRGMEVCFGDNCVGQTGFSRSPAFPYCREGQSTQDLSCISAIAEGKLHASIQNGTAVIVNNASQPYEVSAAVYTQYNNIIEEQDLYDSATTTVQANSAVEIPLEMPSCAWQYDIVCGDVIPDLSEEHYGDEKIYFEFSSGVEYCPQDGSTIPPVIEGDDNESVDNETSMGNETMNEAMDNETAVNETEMNESVTNETMNESMDNESDVIVNVSAEANTSENGSNESIIDELFDFLNGSNESNAT